MFKSRNCVIFLILSLKAIIRDFCATSVAISLQKNPKGVEHGIKMQKRLSQPIPQE